MTPSYDFLVEENRVLRERLAELSGVPAAYRLRLKLGLTGQEAGLLAAILQAPDLISKRALYDAVFLRENGDGPYDEIINVVVCRVRKKAREAGWPGKILNVWGSGYRLDEPMREFLQGIVNPAPHEIAA